MCGFRRCSSLCEQTEAPKQGSAQVEVMKGTGSDKMCREEGGRERQRASSPDKCPHTQTTTTREATRNEQWQQESGAQRGSIAASSWEPFKEPTSLLLIQVYVLTLAELAKQKQINSPKLPIQVFGYPDFHQSRIDLYVLVV